jgi:DNA-binding phage protein
MIHDVRLRNLRAWFAKNKDWIRLTALAKRIQVNHATLYKALSDDAEIQRNVNPDLLEKIIQELLKCNFNPTENYGKAD